MHYSPSTTETPTKIQESDETVLKMYSNSCTTGTFILQNLSLPLISYFEGYEAHCKIKNKNLARKVGYFLNVFLVQ